MVVPSFDVTSIAEGMERSKLSIIPCNKSNFFQYETFQQIMRSLRVLYLCGARSAFGLCYTLQHHLLPGYAAGAGGNDC